LTTSDKKSICEFSGEHIIFAENSVQQNQLTDIKGELQKKM